MTSDLRRSKAPSHVDERLEGFLPFLARIDELRESLHDCTAALIAEVNKSPAKLRSSYHRFLQLGGTTAADLRSYLSGQELTRYQHGASKGHGRLRIISSTGRASSCR
jgi:hypothetical protein